MVGGVDVEGLRFHARLIERQPFEVVGRDLVFWVQVLLDGDRLESLSAIDGFCSASDDS